MVEGPPIALRCRNTRDRTLAVSRQQAWQADDHPPVEPPVSPGGRGGRDQESRDAARIAPQLRHPPARARHRDQNYPGAARSRDILPVNTRSRGGFTTRFILGAARVCSFSGNTPTVMLSWWSFRSPTDRSPAYRRG